MAEYTSNKLPIMCNNCLIFHTCPCLVKIWEKSPFRTFAGLWLIFTYIHTKKASFPPFGACLKWCEAPNGGRLHSLTGFFFEFSQILTVFLFWFSKFYFGKYQEKTEFFLLKFNFYTGTEWWTNTASFQVSVDLFRRRSDFKEKRALLLNS